MSAFNQIDVICESCNQEFKGTVWTAVHAAEDPELKELLLGGELNIFVCPFCQHPAYQDHFILYQDPSAELIAYIYPPSQESDRKFLESTMLSQFREVQKTHLPKDRQGYDPMIVFGLETFVEMMQEEEALIEQSQVAQAVCKENGIPTLILSPTQARKLKLMRILPTDSKEEGSTRLSVLRGLEKLLDKDPALDLYVRLKEVITQDPTWDLVARPLTNSTAI